MGISSIITAGILTGALVFGQTTAETEFPKEIDEVTYNLVPAYVQEVNWSDDSSKLNKLHTKSYIDENGVVHLYNIKDDDMYAMNDTGKNGNRYENNNDGNKKHNDSNKTYSNDSDNGSANRIFSDKVLKYQDMERLAELYKNAGYKHIVVRFPVTKDEPHYYSKSEFLNKIPFDEIQDIAVYGFASPDGRIPEMQEALAEKRKDKVLSYFAKEDIFINTADFFVCDKSVTRDLCWKVDVFYK